MNDSGNSQSFNSAADSQLPASGVRWKILALLMAYAGLVHYNRVSIATAGTEHIMPEYGIDATSMGMVYSSYLFLYTLFMLPGGWLLDKIGPKRALLVVGFGSALLVPMTGLMGRFIPPDPVPQRSSIGTEVQSDVVHSSSSNATTDKAPAATNAEVPITKNDSGGTLTAPILEGFKAVVCLGGTVRSHLGILSREYGIPCLMNSKVAGIKNGDRVELNVTAPAKTAQDYQQGVEKTAEVWKLV